MESIFFLGSCSPKGFVFYSDSLLQECKHLSIIKGGSGCGKSTFMRAIGRAAQARKLNVSYILCSSDPDSLDAVIIPELSVGFVDGTAPHVLEPMLCAGSANYLNFGQFYDREAIKPNEEEILSVQRKNKAQYPLVTACLRAADALFDCVRLSTDRPAYTEELQAIGECICLSSLKANSGSGKLTKRFLSAVTPKGLELCSQTPAALCNRVYCLKDHYGLAPRLLAVVQEKALQQGYDCIACYSPLQPDAQPTHLLIPGANTAIVSDCTNFPYKGESFCSIDLDSTLPAKLRQELEYVQRTNTKLLQQAVIHMEKAKALHDRIEALCRPFVDFRAVSALTERTISQLFG